MLLVHFSKGVSMTLRPHLSSCVRTDLFPCADVQPFHHFGKRPPVDHFAHQIGAHPFGVGKAPQQLPGDPQGGRRQPLPVPGWAAQGFASALRHHDIQDRLQRCSWHPGRDPMWPAVRHTVESKKERSGQKKAILTWTGHEKMVVTWSPFLVTKS